MVVITVPYDPRDFERPSIFLGGAITGAPDWQSQAIQMLEPFATCFNPRRPDGFVPPNHPEYLQQYEEQVRWEHKYLLVADVVLFWMPAEALSITTRFEIGWWFGMNYLLANNGKPLRPFAVGVEPGVKGETYFRITLPKINVPVHSTLQATCASAYELVKKVSKSA
jgi:hypothetical protein